MDGDEPGAAGALGHRRAAAERLRHLAGVLAAGELDPAALAGAAAELEDLADRLGPAPADGAASAWAQRMADQAEQAAGGGTEPDSAADSQGHHPLYAGASGVFPPFELTGDDTTLAADTCFGAGFEGPPGLVHGGFLAAGFDMVLSALALRVLGHSVTRWLRLRYLGPVFLDRPVRYEVVAGERQGRLLTLSGRLVSEERVALRAESQFVAMDLGRFANRRSTM